MSEPINPVLIHHLTPKNFLSFGPEHPGIELQALNVFIGPNGSGKSNLIEAVSLMRSATKDMRAVTRKGGGVAEWIWKGEPNGAASVDWVVRGAKGLEPLRHVVSFRSVAQSFSLDDERVEDAERRAGQEDVSFYYHYQHGHPSVNTAGNGKRPIARETIDLDRSILAKMRDPETYPELAWLAQNYEQIRIYREWAFGRNAVFREPQEADMRNDALEEDFSNLGLFLNLVKTHFPVAKKAILQNLKDLYDGIVDFEISFREARFRCSSPRMTM
ncbi:MAG TPA: AAA family ATPase [Thermoanaerobaculia bacterium]|jgi:predicted ATPase|nr:AAA family ATPase [Thermoanaerobaculia bacterium]